MKKFTSLLGVAVATTLVFSMSTPAFADTGTTPVPVTESNAFGIGEAVSIEAVGPATFITAPQPIITPTPPVEPAVVTEKVTTPTPETPATPVVLAEPATTAPTPPVNAPNAPTAVTPAPATLTVSGVKKLRYVSPYMNGATLEWDVPETNGKILYYTVIIDGVSNTTTVPSFKFNWGTPGGGYGIKVLTTATNGVETKTVSAASFGWRTPGTEIPLPLKSEEYKIAKFTTIPQVSSKTVARNSLTVQWTKPVYQGLLKPHRIMVLEGSKVVANVTVPAGQTTATIPGLKPGTLYAINVYTDITSPDKTKATTALTGICIRTLA